MTTFKKTLTAAFAGAGLLFSANAFAIASPDTQIPPTADQVQDLIVANASSYKANPAAFRQMLNSKLGTLFDVRYISQLALGKYWRTATPAQRDRFVAAFQNGFINAYGDAMLELADDVKLVWTPTRVSPDATQTTIRGTLNRKNGSPVQLGFVARAVGDQWKIFDVKIENISLITNFRAQLNRDLQGMTLDQLIAQMESGAYFKKNAGRVAGKGGAGSDNTPDIRQ